MQFDMVFWHKGFIGLKLKSYESKFGLIIVISNT